MIKRILEVPTGHIMIIEGERGLLECLSIGDYGQGHNIKASFLGLDRPLGMKVEHHKLLDLEEKWVITVSTQYGCSMRCSFCDVPKVGAGRNASVEDLVDQFWAAFGLHPEVTYSKRINLHYARMGEPTWNRDVLHSAYAINERLKGNNPDRSVGRYGPYTLHPVISTMMPRYNKDLEAFLLEWCEMKNGYFHGNAGLQLSINSTSDKERELMFSGNAMTLRAAAELMAGMPFPRGRKYTLNFAIAGWEIDANKLAQLFDPDRFIVKLTPMHKTETALLKGIKTEGDCTSTEPYEHIEEALKKVGFDVLVFIASEEEDLGRITCGNAILAGTVPEVAHTDLTFK
jgi:23S rRNA (adenine2503-C2)-methyltransferase